MSGENPLLISAINLFKKCLAVKPDEKILLIFDSHTRDIANALVEASLQLPIQVKPVEIKPTGKHGGEPDPEIAELMKKFHAVLIPTKYSMTHTKATIEARAAGAKVVTLPGIDAYVFIEGLKADPLKLKVSGDKWINILSGNHEIKVTSKEGTNLMFSIGRHPFLNDEGCFFEKGSGGNLPAGEVFVAPDEDSGNGKLVVDGAIGGQEEWKTGDSPAELILENGTIKSFSGKRARKLELLLSKSGPKAFVLAEFGIGTNPCLQLSGNLLGDEKVRGTVHFAFGNNMGFGGKNNVQLHIDCIVSKPSVYIDGKQVVKDGVWLTLT